MNDFKVKILDKNYEIAQSADGKTIFVNDKPFTIELIKKLGNTYNVFSVNGRNFRVGIDEIENNKFNFHLENRDLIVETIDSKAEVIQQYMKSSTSGEAGGNTKIKAPMPGLVVKILKQTGDSVKKGETVAIIEAMKMENSIKANTDGSILTVKITEGKPVAKEEVMFEIG
jgi:biotin carboxyl carrier protein